MQVEGLPRRGAQLRHGVPGPLQPLASGLRESPSRRDRRPRRRISARALNARGEVLLPVAARPCCGDERALRQAAAAGGRAAAEVAVVVPEPVGVLAEEERSRRPTVFSALREVIADLACRRPAPGTVRRVRLRPRRSSSSRSSCGIDRPGQPARPGPAPAGRDLRCSTASARRPSATATTSRWTACRRRACRARRRRHLGRVPGRSPFVTRSALPAEPGLLCPGRRAAPGSGSPAATCSRWCPATPSTRRAPRPPPFYQPAAAAQPGAVRVLRSTSGEGSTWSAPRPRCTCGSTGDRVETCPISGTIRARQRRRWRTPRSIRDAAQLGQGRESELTMCTDVDRNDKSRICVPGSVRVIGRRQIEMYSPPDPHRRPRRGRLRPGLRRARRVPHPRVGGHRDRRAQDVGDAVHRGPRAVAARAGTAARSA